MTINPIQISLPKDISDVAEAYYRKKQDMNTVSDIMKESEESKESDEELNMRIRMIREAHAQLFFECWNVLRSSCEHNDFEHLIKSGYFDEMKRNVTIYALSSRCDPFDELFMKYYGHKLCKNSLTLYNNNIY